MNMNISNPNQMETHLQPIKTMQTYLRSIAKVYPEIPSIVPDGIYGEETTAAVRAFQKIFGLPVTGEVNLGTWELIVFVYDQLQAIMAEPKGVYPYPNEILCDTCVLKPCDNGDVVTILQIMLNALSRNFWDFEPIEISGYYNQETARQVKTFQNRLRLTETGTVDKQTWNSLTQFYNLHADKDLRSGKFQPVT